MGNCIEFVNMSKTVEDKFWLKVDIKGLYDCWNYKESKNSKGYGVFWDTNKVVAAHRYAFMSKSNRILLPGELVLHRCDNPACCNPDHLYCGSYSDNNSDTISRKRKDLKTQATKISSLHAGEIWLIRRLKKTSKHGKKMEWTEFVASMFKISIRTISRIWSSDTYLSRDGNFV